MINDRIQIVASHHPGVIVYERQVIWTDSHMVKTLKRQNANSFNPTKNLT